jgi:hypothetical protein
MLVCAQLGSCLGIIIGSTYGCCKIALAAITFWLPLKCHMHSCHAKCQRNATDHLRSISCSYIVLPTHLFKQADLFQRNLSISERGEQQ